MPPPDMLKYTLYIGHLVYLLVDLMSDYAGDHKSNKLFHSRFDAIYESLKGRLDASEANHEILSILGQARRDWS